MWCANKCIESSSVFHVVVLVLLRIRAIGQKWFRTWQEARYAMCLGWPSWKCMKISLRNCWGVKILSRTNVQLKLILLVQKCCYLKCVNLILLWYTDDQMRQRFLVLASMLCREMKRNLEVIGIVDTNFWPEGCRFAFGLKVEMLAEKGFIKLLHNETEGMGFPLNLEVVWIRPSTFKCGVTFQLGCHLP